MKISVETLVNAPVAKVWSAYTTPEDIKQWNTASHDWHSFGGRAGIVEFVPGAKGVTVRVTFDAETTNSEEQQRQGWQAILNNFAKHVATKDKSRS